MIHLEMPLEAKPEGFTVELDTTAQPADPLEYISASRLKSFLTCRLRFYFEKVLGLQQPVNVKAHLGRCVHSALKEFHRARWLDKPLSQAQLLEVFHKEFWATEARSHVEDVPDEDWRKQSMDGERVLLAYMISGVQPLAERPIGVEVPLKEDIPDLPLPLYGIVDLIRPGPVAVDFKTVAATPNLEIEGWLHEVQLVTYALLIEAATGEPIEGSELVFLVKTKQPKVIAHRVEAPTPVQRARFRTLANQYVKAVQNQDYYPCPGQHCSWCPFREPCAAWQGMGKVES